MGTDWSRWKGEYLEDLAVRIQEEARACIPDSAEFGAHVDLYFELKELSRRHLAMSKAAEKAAASDPQEAA